MAWFTWFLTYLIVVGTSVYVTYHENDGDKSLTLLSFSIPTVAWLIVTTIALSSQ